MDAGPDHEIVDLKLAPGELSFEARIGDAAKHVWFRTDTPVTPTADAALGACLMPAMRAGGRLTMAEPVSPRVLRMQREFQGIQRAWSLNWDFGDPPLREVEVVAPTRLPQLQNKGRVAAFFSGGVDSWSTILANPEVTDLIFVRGIDLVPGAAHQTVLADEVEARLREATAALGLSLHVVETNVRELSDPLARWETYYGCAVVSVALMLAPIFERVLIAGDSDYEVQVRFGANWLVDQLWSTEQLEVVDDGGRFSRMERLARIVDHPVVQRTLRVCWENPGGAYNCGRCRKCLMTMTGLEALGGRESIQTFPPELDLEAVGAIELRQPVLLTLWEDVLDAALKSNASDLASAVGTVVANGKRNLGLPPSYRRRHDSVRLAQGPPPSHEIADLRSTPGELSFEARIDGAAQRVWFRTKTAVTPTADAALVACLMPAMRSGGTLTLADPVSPRLLRTQREFQGIQRAWSLDWDLGEAPLHEVSIIAPTRRPTARPTGRVAAFFSGGVDSWSTILANPEVTDLIFVRGLDLVPGAAHQVELADEVEERLREAAASLELPLHVVDTNLRELSDRLVRWEAYNATALAAVALFLEPLFDRVLLATDTDHETQVPIGSSAMVDQLLGTERLEIADDGGRLNREQRLREIVDHPVVQRTLRVCWENRGGAYNCGRCRKCVMTMISLEALGIRDRIATFPPELNLDWLADFELDQPISLALWEDALDTARATGRVDLERAVEAVVATGKRVLGLPASHRGRPSPGPPASVRVVVIVPAWRQPQFLAAAVHSALEQDAAGVGVVIVNDGCPYPSAERIGRALRDANPDRVAYLHQSNRGLSGARNTGIRHAFSRWPQLRAIFPLDADNMLSPQTLTDLWAVLEEHPEADWASPVLEFFGAEDGEWQIPGPYLPHRQLFTNQCDAGSLIRRSVFEAGIEFDETMKEGFEDWEFFLEATLAGFQGVKAGRCGFRYQRRPHSMLVSSQQRAERIEAGLRRRHRTAYGAAALNRAEHAEAPRFALVRCDREDVLLTASCDLDPHRLPLGEFLRPGPPSGTQATLADLHTPAVTVLTNASTLDWLEGRRLLPGVLLRIQAELRRDESVGLRIGAPAGGELSALALRTSALPRLASTGVDLEPAKTIEVDAGGGDMPPSSLSGASSWAAVAGIGPAVHFRQPFVPATSHPSFFEARHLDLLETTLPWSGTEDGRIFLALAPGLSGGESHRDMFELVDAMRVLEPCLTAHLVLTVDTAFESGSTEPFDTVTALGGVDPETARILLRQLAAGADAVVHAGVPDAFAVLPGIPEWQRGAQVVLATAASGAEDEEHDVLAARRYEPLVDLYLAPSSLVARRLANLAVVPDKIVTTEPGSAPTDRWSVAGRAVLDVAEDICAQRDGVPTEVLAA